jgi:hypothetical protein
MSSAGTAMARVTVAPVYSEQGKEVTGVTVYYVVEGGLATTSRSLIDEMPIQCSTRRFKSRSSRHKRQKACS